MNKAPPKEVLRLRGQRTSKPKPLAPPKYMYSCISACVKLQDMSTTLNALQLMNFSYMVDACINVGMDIRM